MKGRSALLAALLLSGCQHPSSTLPQRSLNELVPHAQIGPLLGPPDLLGRFPATPFCGSGWQPLTGADYRTTQGTAQLRFYLTQVTDLEVVLEGRCGKPQVATLELPDGSQRQISLQMDWSVHALELPAAMLREGPNLVSIRCPQASDWKRAEIRVRHRGDKATPLSQQEPIRIAFGTTLEIPIQLNGNTQLAWDDLDVWLEPGAASLKERWKLEIRLQTGERTQNWTVERGGSLRLEWPPAKAQMALVTLSASCSAQPLLGQAGLILRGARVAGASPAQVQSSEPAVAKAPALTKPRHIILYLVDTLRCDRLSCYGGKGRSTPHFDALAADGVRFAECMAQSNWTKPAVASIMTSLLPHQHGAQGFADRLSPQHPHLARILQGAGYRTRAVVCNPFLGKEFGFSEGFQSYRERHSASVEELQREALAQLPAGSATPSTFLYVHVLEPHLPYAPPRAWRPPAKASFSVAEMQQLRQEWERLGPSPRLRARAAQAEACYDGEIAHCDAAFGAFVQELKKRGIYDDSLIILVSDHGEQFFEHNLCDHMNSLYQELLHVPLIVKFPQQREAGSIVTEVTQHIDIAPTIMKAAGLEPNEEMRGTAYPQAPSSTPRPAYFSACVGEESERFGQGQGSGKVDMEGLRLGSWVIHRARSTLVNLEPLQLFQLHDDPHEMENLAFRRPEVRGWLLWLLRNLGPQQTSTAPQADPQEVERSLRSLQYLR